MLYRELPISHSDEDDILGALIGRAKQGSVDAFSELAVRLRWRIRYWAVRVLDDRDDADDVAQQVLLKLHARIAEFEGRSRFTTWLYRMTINIALNRRRVERRRSALLRTAHVHEATVTSEGPADAEQRRLAELVRACLTQLSERERQVFQMADLDGMPANEIATALGLQPVSVRAALSRARRRIRLKMLEQHAELLEEYDI
ncbi:MAG TPA: sigma-70 family RNA polymerase sigma factor [Gemmatimonadaceae bacterium]